MRVIVVGAGVGGLAAAIALRRRGIDVAVVEQASSFEQVGAGLQLSPNATRVLRGWGLERALRTVGFAPHAVEVRSSGSGRLLLRTPLGEAAERRWGAPYVQVHRADLHGLLLEGLAALGGGRFVRLHSRVTGVESTAGAAAVRLDSGEMLRADAVIGADGLRSAVRQALWGPTPARFTGQVAWRATVDANGLPSGLVRPVAGVWTGRRKHFVHYPIRGGALINQVGIVEQDWREESWSVRGDPEDFARAFQNWPEPVASLTRAVDTVWRWALYERPPLPRWSKGVATLLGDAAHPMLPFLAQGAAMAIEDAEALARRLAEGRSVPAALERYEQDRRARTAKAQAWSRRNARLFHLPAPLARAAFGAAGLLDSTRRGGSAARLDWLYGYGGSNGP